MADYHFLCFKLSHVSLSKISLFHYLRRPICIVFCEAKYVDRLKGFRKEIRDRYTRDLASGMSTNRSFLEDWAATYSLYLSPYHWSLLFRRDLLLVLSFLQDFFYHPSLIIIPSRAIKATIPHDKPNGFLHIDIWR